MMVYLVTPPPKPKKTVFSFIEENGYSFRSTSTPTKARAMAYGISSIPVDRA
jgi:hypothetical protein